MAEYTLGLDFGTLSVRALIADIRDGREVASAEAEYAHGVMDRELPCGKKLGADWALQDAEDYLQAMCACVPEAVRRAGAQAEEILGIGVDFTSCTVLPAKADGTPLSVLHPEEPNAYVKLWKHHAAQYCAERIEKLAVEENRSFLRRYGGKVSSESALPKTWQILAESPELYREADCITEAGDWIVWQLTGRRTANAAMAGYKAWWSPADGYPPQDFLRELQPELENAYTEKLAAPILPSGAKAGELTPEMAERLGLLAGTPVTAAHIDAHVTLAAVKAVHPGILCAIMGTSSCHIILDREEKIVPGFCGVAADGAIPGYYALEAGQCCVGDHFRWFAENCVPARYEEEARTRGIGIHELLTEKMAQLRPGESGLLALDWWNGNRSVLVDPDLTGLILGLTLRTRAEEIYRALIEATAYGARMIVEAYRAAGVEVREMVAAGGIARKNAVLMQIYADVLNMPIRVGASSQSGALASAIFAAAAATGESAADCAERMGALEPYEYVPCEENARIYEKLYREYAELHDLFGRGGCDCMKRLKNLAHS